MPGKHTTNHNAISAGCYSFGNVAGLLNSAIGNQGNICSIGHTCHIHYGCNLRHANTRHYTCCAYTPRTDTNLHAIGTRFYELPITPEQVAMAVEENR